ncbi:DNA-binding response regulator [Nonomuraea sp. NPDC050556]|uniref:DNA-binding response regulator n=1 Tax=Nonomuraea sp. NPDC050556 TaxID=3364369 RepID=UPI0037A754E9
MIRVGVMAEQPVTVLGICAVFSEVPDIEVTTTGATPDDIAVGAADVLLVDMHLGCDVPVVEVVRESARHARIVVMAGVGRAETARSCADAGAVGYLSRCATPAEIEATVRSAAGGERLDDAVAGGAPEPELSPRENAVLQYIALGLTHAQIARKLGISVHTVDTYTKRVRAKLNLGNKAELTRAALRMPA